VSADPGSESAVPGPAVSGPGTATSGGAEAAAAAGGGGSRPARVVVVTGAGGGIGRATCLRYAAEGAVVAVVEVDPATCAGAAAEIAAAGGTPLEFPIDVADESAVAAMAAAVDERCGRVDVLVHGAIQRMPGHLESLPTESFDRLLAVGLRGGFLLGRELGKIMLRRGSGVLVFIGSTAAHAPYPNTGAYAPCKAALMMLAKSFALEWAGRGVRSFSVSPGMVRTPMTEDLYSRPEILAGRSAVAPLGRIGSPEEIASLIHYLASAEASYLTGTDVLIDGGFTTSKFMHVPGRD
jgi:NAD(P)-dependent dehydrogenase (short-subunit alcohol dehydrogenase family)